MKVSDAANPRQTILVTSRAEIASKFSPEKKIKDNIFTLSWHMPVSHEPSMYAISSGKERFSTKLIKESKVFVVNFMPLKLEKEVLFCGMHSGEHIDKFKETGLEKEEAEKIDCARIKQACGSLECKVVNEIEAGDHIIFIGEVINIKLNNKEKRIFQKEEEIFTTTK